MTNITGKNFVLTEGIKGAVDTNFKKIAQLIDDETDVKVFLSVKVGHKKSKCAEITIRNGKDIIRAEVLSDDMYQSISQAFNATAERLKKNKERKRKRSDRTSIRIVKEKNVEAPLMTTAEACDEMEQTDHDFYIFTNVETGDLSVVYRRKDGLLGILVVPDDSDII